IRDASKADDDPEDEFEAWMQRNAAQIEQVSVYLDRLDDLLDTMPSWEMLLRTRRQVEDMIQQLRLFVEQLGEASDYLRRPENIQLNDALVTRATALVERMEEGRDEIIRRLGEIGSAHDARPMQRKRSRARPSARRGSARPRQ